ncbi:MAG: leucine-rich repeat domain-containing protein [Firmicutes bacterium]|nr:leucine-rich repeat domain-containing protein [Bacillota bacterium]
MKPSVKNKIITIASALSLLLLAIIAIAVTQLASDISVAYAHQFDCIDDSDSAKETIAYIEEMLVEQDTNILAVFEEMLQYNKNRLSVEPEHSDEINMLIASINESIEQFERIHTYEYYGIQPFFIGNLYYEAAVRSIAAGFWTAGWRLASDLMFFNLSNNIVDVRHRPARGYRIANTIRIQNHVAFSDNVTGSNNFPREAMLNLMGWFGSVYDEDSHYAIGGFWYTKTCAGGGNVRISLIDRYDWAHETGEGYSGFLTASLLNTLYRAENRGVVTAFYTVIDVVVPGRVPFNFAYVSGGFSITGVPQGIASFNMPEWIYDLRIDPRDGIWPCGNNHPRTNLTQIGANAFQGFMGYELYIPSTITSIGSGAFANTDLLVHLTSDRTHIQDDLFRGAPVRRVNIPNGVTHIGARAFEGFMGYELHIPSTITSIGVGAFENTLSLARIDVAEGNRHFASKNGILYNAMLSEFVHIPLALGGHVEIPLGVHSIPQNAFEGRRITSIFIPNTVTYMGVSAFRNARYLERVDFEMGIDLFIINYHAFYETSSLRNFSIPTSVRFIRCHAFERSGLESISIPWQIITIGSYAFANTRNMTRLDISPQGGSLAIEFGAFEGSDLRSVTLPHTVISVGAFAFAYNRNLTSLTFDHWSGSWLTTIGDFAFEGTDLRSLHIPGNVMRIGNNAFAYNRNLTSLTFGSGLTDIGNNAFEGTRITEVVIPQSVTHIGNHAFAYNRNLTSVTFAPNSRLVAIGNHAFEGTGITEIVIPNGVTHIGNSAFANSSLTSVEFGDNSSLVSIGTHAFFGVAITQITLPETLQIIGARAFSRTTLESVIIPRSVAFIGISAFRDNGLLVSVYIPDSVITIEDVAFDNCRMLTIFAEPSYRPVGWSISWHGFRPVVWGAVMPHGVSLLCDDADIVYEYILALYADDTTNTLPDVGDAIVTGKQVDEYSRECV